MFREMRRNKQALSEDAALQILNNASHGVLALDGDDGYTYAVPLNYAYKDGKIYFHAALTGHKLDAIKNNDKISFCVVNKDEVVPEKFTSYYSSVIVFGKIKVITDDADPEKRRGLELLADKYSPNESAESREREIGGKLKALVVMVIEVEHMTGKAARELMNH